MSVEWLFGPGRERTRFGEVPAFREGLYRIADGAYAWMVPNGSWGETNIGWVDCGGSSILIDTCWDLRCTDEVLGALGEKLRRSPIETVINTHSDGDHCWGNQRFGDCRIVATETAIDRIRHLQPQTLTALKRGGRLLRHLPVAGVGRFGHYVSHMFGPYDFSGVTLTPPNSGFSESTALTVNGVEAVITEVGPAHTDGDAIVHFPHKRLVYAGDIAFVGSTPVMWSGPYENLVAGLKALLSLDVDVIVPGHGALATKADIQLILDYWEYVHDALHRCFQRDMPALAAAREVVLGPDFQSRPFAGWDSPERLVTNCHTLYRHWGARPSALPEKLATMEILRQQARLALELPGARPRVMHGRA